jgi:hypothetical protein
MLDICKAPPVCKICNHRWVDVIPASEYLLKNLPPTPVGTLDRAKAIKAELDPRVKPFALSGADVKPESIEKGPTE